MSEFHLPENAEASVIGCILLCPDTKRKAAGLISAADFKSDFYRALFESAMELESPDSTVFREAVRKRGFTLPDGFFRELGDIAISRANLGLYCQLLREASQRRRLSALASDILADVTEERAPAEVAAAAASRLSDISRSAVDADIADPADACNAFLDHRERVEAGAGAVPTGICALDQILGGGMLRSGLYILAARPGVGKTTLALQVSDEIAKNSGTVLFVSLEMSVEQLQGKRVARLTGIPSDSVLLGPAESIDYRKVAAAVSELGEIPVYISRRPSATVAQIRRMAMSVEGLTCVVVDYLGRIAPSDRRASRYEAVTAISADLKSLAAELGVPVLALCQLNRENTGRNDKRPQLSDLRDSGAIEQDADCVLMLHREDYYEMQESPLKPWEGVELEIIVRKNRHGRIGSCKAGFFPAAGRIIERGKSA